MNLKSFSKCVVPVFDAYARAGKKWSLHSFASFAPPPPFLCTPKKGFDPRPPHMSWYCLPPSLQAKYEIEAKIMNITETALDGVVSEKAAIVEDITKKIGN